MSAGDKSSSGGDLLSPQSQGIRALDKSRIAFVSRDSLARVLEWDSSHWGTWLELGVLSLAAIVFAAPILNFDPQMHPQGGDYLMTVQFHTVWLRFRECGLCFFWNGNLNGGSPAFADLFPSSLHPLVIVTTLGWGVINGSKLAIVGMLLMAGFAQWWLARSLGLGWLARMWSGLLAVVAGNLAGRFQMGWFGVALATAAAALALAALVNLALSPTRRAAVYLGLALASAAVAGQGYMQFGLVLMLPLVVILLPWGKPDFGLVLRRYGLACVVALLLAAPLLLPLALNWSEFSKAFEVNLKGILSFNFIPLSFVVRDPKFFESRALGMEPYPALYVNFIGWVAMILAVIGVRLARPGKETRVMIFMITGAAVAVVLASLEPRQILIDRLADSDLVFRIQALRSSPVIAGLAVLPILALGAIGVDRLYAKLGINLQVALQGAGSTRPFVLRLNWLLVLPLVWSVLNTAQATQIWLASVPYFDAIPHVVNALVTPTLQWVQPPFGESAYLVPSMERGLKVSKYPFGWGWKDRPAPLALLYAESKWVPEATTAVGPIDGADGVTLFRSSPNQEYALIRDETGTATTCGATGNAGDIDVECNAEKPGTLTLMENNWSGWSATVDGTPAPLLADSHLGVQVPAGKHEIQFRFRPLDGILGFLLFGAGLFLCVFLVREKNPPVDYPVSPRDRRPIPE